MKLRNKKTGEVFESFKRGPIDLYFYPNEHKGGDDIERETYQSLAELNDEWEDYAPKEPLIKDEKIRKAVRAWASTFGDIRKIAVKYDAARVSFHFGAVDSSIEFGDDVDIDCEDRQLYTIDELCGDEEE